MMTPRLDNPGGSTVPMTGFIRAVSGTTPGPASGITYTVAVNTLEGVVEWAGVKPSNQRAPDAYDVVAAGVGTMVLVQEFAGKHWFYIMEYPDSDVCEEDE